MNDEVGSWVRYAEENLRTARLCLDDGLLNPAIQNAQQAVEATKVADGVIQGASVMRRMLKSGPDAVGEYVAEVRNALDLAHSTN